MSTVKLSHLAPPRKEIQLNCAPLLISSSSCKNPATVPALHPLAAQKYYDSPGKRLLFHFIEDFLQIDIISFQSAFGSAVGDQIGRRGDVVWGPLCGGILGFLWILR
jgi:hypothetical protein